jgi:hypothetical protein
MRRINEIPNWERERICREYQNCRTVQDQLKLAGRSDLTRGQLYNLYSQHLARTPASRGWSRFS